VKADIKVPAVGESISEATIGEWAKKNGEFVKRDEVILLLETDKASVEVVAPNDGVLQTLAKAGDVVKIGATVATIDTEGVATAGQPAPSQNKSAEAVAPAVAMAQAGSAGGRSGGKSIAPELQQAMSPAVRRVVDERGLDPEQISGTGKDGRLTKSDAENAPAMGAGAVSANGSFAKPAGASAPAAGKGELPPLPRAKGAVPGEVKRVPMTTIRKRIAERLVQAQHTAAILTTFNEVDMTAVLELREKYKDRYKEKYGVSLGFMGFFVKAVIEALKAFPQVNASIEGTDLLYKNFYNIGVAVGTEKGLVVPVIRDADQLTISEIEMAIKHYAVKARDGKLTVADLSEGTFTISNGGVYGSLMSTPILNPPQSGILGMHKIQERPMAIGKQVVIRPMMYLAMSYDHRMIDGKEAVSFLVKVKECIEDPSRILLEV
jgi:2-oxoglutarate dehydrogenase E2 component (dihydrolipoamide succinyltransferase)